MSRPLPRWITLFAALLVSPVLAASRTECWDGSCLTRGWTVTSRDGDSAQDFGCTRDDCSTQGWVSSGTMAPAFYAQCMEGGCFGEGWYEQDRWSHQLLRQIRCNERGGARDCLRFGWDVYESAGTTVVSCIHDDCRHEGWTMVHPGYRYEESKCLSGDCFGRGWTSSP